MAAKQVPLQQEVIHERHEQQQRGKAARNKGHKVAQLCQHRGGKLLQILLCCLMTGVKPAHTNSLSKVLSGIDNRTAATASNIHAQYLWWLSLCTGCASNP